MPKGIIMTKEWKTENDIRVINIDFIIYQKNQKTKNKKKKQNKTKQTP